RRWLGETRDPTQPFVLGGDFNVAPADIDVWDPRRAHGGTHVSPPERAAFARLIDWGLVDAYRLHHGEPERYTWWDYGAHQFQRPSNRIVAGTSSTRMTDASRATAMAIATPRLLIVMMSASPNALKTVTITRAAPVITPAVRESPSTTDSVLSPVRR